MIKTNQANQDLSLNDKVFKGIFCATKEEIADLVKTADWTASVQLAEQASEQIGGGLWMPAVSVARCEPMAVLWQWLENPADGFRPRITTSVFCYMQGYEWALLDSLPKRAAQDLVIHPEHLARAIASTETRTMMQERLRREAREEAAVEREKVNQAAKEAENEEQAWTRRLRFFNELYRNALYGLWNEEFIKRDELDFLLNRFQTTGLLRDAATALKDMRNQLIDHMAVPEAVDRYQTPTKEQISTAADTLASWINGELFVGVNPLAGHHSQLKAAVDTAQSLTPDAQVKKQAETMANNPFAKLALLKK